LRSRAASTSASAAAGEPADDDSGVDATPEGLESVDEGPESTPSFRLSVSLLDPVDELPEVDAES